MAAKTTSCRKKIMSLQRILLPRNRDSIEVLWPVQGYVEVTRGVVFKPPFSPPVKEPNREFSEPIQFASQPT
jgi:hypothetical protein